MSKNDTLSITGMIKNSFRDLFHPDSEYKLINYDELIEIIDWQQLNLIDFDQLILIDKSQLNLIHFPTLFVFFKYTFSFIITLGLLMGFFASYTYIGLKIDNINTHKHAYQKVDVMKDIANNKVQIISPAKERPTVNKLDEGSEKNNKAELIVLEKNNELAMLLEPEYENYADLGSYDYNRESFSNNNEYAVLGASIINPTNSNACSFRVNSSVYSSGSHFYGVNNSDVLLCVDHSGEVSYSTWEITGKSNMNDTNLNPEIDKNLSDCLSIKVNAGTTITVNVYDENAAALGYCQLVVENNQLASTY
jgi:hypothetical protein